MVKAINIGQVSVTRQDLYKGTQQMNTFTYQLADYSEIRDITKELYPKILKMISRQDLDMVCKQLGLGRNGTIGIDIESEQGFALLQDYLIYSYRPNKINMAELFLRINRDQLSAQQIDLLARMSQAKFGFARLSNANPELHTLAAKDILTNEEFVIVDVSTSQQITMTKLFIGHWINCDNFYIQTGAGMSVPSMIIAEPELQLIVSSLAHKLQQGQKLSVSDTSKLAKICIRYLLQYYV